MPARKKRRRHGKPHKAVRVTTYQRLEEYLRAFAAGHFHLVVLVGAGGVGKSRSVRSVLNGKGCWIEGNATPFGMYVKLYRHRDQFVVIDDVDALYADRSGVRLLKCLCQTEEEKAVAWHSDAKSLERQGIPREFVTKSRVVIISNDWTLQTYCLHSQAPLTLGSSSPRINAKGLNPDPSAWSVRTGTARSRGGTGPPAGGAVATPARRPRGPTGVARASFASGSTPAAPNPRASRRPPGSLRPTSAATTRAARGDSGTSSHWPGRGASATD